MTGEKYYFCNSRFKAQIQNGILLGASVMGDSESVPYLEEAKGFGNLCLTWEKEGERKEWQPLQEVEYADSVPRKRGRSVTYEGSVVGEDLKVTVRYLLGETLEQEVLVENRASSTVTLLDFALRLSCHSRFTWGGETGREMIGHHFISGHGSHSTVYRCDGKGKLMAVFPCGDSQWVHYEKEPVNPAKEREAAEEKGTVLLYALDGCIGRKREEEGAKLRIPPRSATLEPGEAYRYRGKVLFAKDYEDCREQLVKHGQVMAESIPGYTVPREHPVLLALRSDAGDLRVETEDADAEKLKVQGGRHIFRLTFRRLGEHTVRVSYDGKWMQIYYFVTQDVRTMMEKRAGFIAGKQILDSGKWYNGLLAEYNNETGAILSPDNYDRIGGWRIYEVTCDDPGLSKPAFLSSVQTVAPVQAQIDALDDYIEHFVWGGLQQTTEEPFPYGIYGIPDWHVLRNSEDMGNGGRTHLWRPYDYSHIALTYYNMYEVAAYAEGVTTRLPAKEYLKRAYGTARAMFTVPAELEGWTAYETGFYNELVIPEIIRALGKEGMELEARTLEGHWNRKAEYFVRECKDVFGSEYPFDTTGFESTHVLAARGTELARIQWKQPGYGQDITFDKAIEFMENQTSCNIACRGVLEPAYFWYGSDYRGDNLHYTLSYMTQMGGSSLLDYACYYAEEPYGLLRLAYGSVLGSWALLNCGDEESGYGYWFPGKEKDGCACGGFEPLYCGETWLNQPHKGGPWYYSCEIDLGFCGGLRGAAAVVAEDPVFGRICYGGALTEERDGLGVVCRDGVGRRFHYIGAEGRVHAECTHGEWDGILISRDFGRIELTAAPGPWKKEGLAVRVLIEDFGDYRLAGTDVVLQAGEWAALPVPEGEARFRLERV
ncbi:MAG: hypothetical protein HFH92_08980 [Lachnospiraceae bacterium]|nr:DUF5695 domain-containing protein [uncultured Acetatifactor sp.]MCI8789226.1 hypothetical protein [Lachnospiraceae bacterium]